MLRLIRSIRHTRARQLAARASLLVRRKLRRALPLSGGGRSAPAVSDAPPLALFPPRTELVQRGELVLLGRRYPLSWAFDWPADAVGRSTQLERVTLHYLEYAEGLETEAFEAAVLGWVARNPQRAPNALDAWNSYALSIRCVVFMQQYARRRDAVSPDTLARLQETVAEQIGFLARNLETDLGGNHLIKNIKALLWAGRFFTGPRAESWARVGARLLVRELAEQIPPDGMHYERSAAYHAQICADLLECHHVLEPGALRDELGRALHRALQVLVDLTHPDGDVSLFNDAGLHMAYSTEACVDVYEQMFGRRPDPRPSFGLQDAGYFGARRNGSYVLFDCGRIAPDFLPAHGHGDILAFEWTVDGMRLLVDAGVYEYQQGEARAYSRATSSHNTVTVADEDQCEFWSSFRVGRRASVRVHTYDAEAEGFLLEGSHDGFARLAGRPVHRRRAQVRVDAISVEDRIEGGAGQPVVARLLCHPDCEIDGGAGVWTIRRGPVAVRLTTDAEVEVREAWWSPDMGVRVPAPQIVLHYGAAPCDGSFQLTK